MDDNKVEVSIVIVCMNNLKNLYPCLDSFKEYTTVSYELFVVAYMFSEENLKRLIADYPWVIIVESNEIRGFSENNNLALKQAKGDYCLVVNDDTYHEMPLVDKLVADLRVLPSNAVVVSPSFWNADGTLQSNGRTPFPLYTYFFNYLRLGDYIKRKREHSKYVNQQGLYQTYNLSGACFLIKTDVFREVDWFDERFFFCPEDNALSTLLNNKGYECWVDADVKITHLGGQSSSSMMQTAIFPAKVKGDYIWYSENNLLKKFFFIFNAYLLQGMYGIKAFFLYHFTHSKQQQIAYLSQFHALRFLVTQKTPKEIFTHYYLQLKDAKRKD